MGSQKCNACAIQDHAAAFFVHSVDHRLRALAVEVRVEPPIGGIPLDIMGNVLERRPSLPPYIDDDLLEILAGNMMPNGQFTDPSETVDPEFQLAFAI